MYPFVTCLGTLFANVFGGRSDFDLVDVSASFVHRFSPVLAVLELPRRDFRHVQPSKIAPKNTTLPQNNEGDFSRVKA
jgi:hypothetical protein